MRTTAEKYCGTTFVNNVKSCTVCNVYMCTVVAGSNGVKIMEWSVAWSCLQLKCHTVIMSEGRSGHDDVCMA